MQKYKLNLVFISDKKASFISSIAFILLFLTCIFLVYIPSQSDFPLISTGYLLAFAAYLLIYKYCSSKYFFPAILLGVSIRLILIFALPNLSDDLYRFIWDGRLIHHGISPYAYLPSNMLEKGLEGVNGALFAKLNSPDYYSIYPPLSQAVFYLSSWPSLGIYESNLIMKFILLLIELSGSYFLVKLLRQNNESEIKGKRLFLLLFLNPLLIVEASGNLHFEIAVISLLSIGLYFLQKRKLVYSGLFIACSIGIKLIPLILLPFIFFKLKDKERWVFTLATSFFLFVIFLPLALGLELSNFLESIDLYFRKFEFNGSFYQIFRQIGFWFKGYNQIALIGPSTALFVLFFCFAYIFRSIYQKRLFTISELALYGLAGLSIYYFTSTTVHPWYIINLLFLSVFTRFKFPIVWSLLITLTYINYSYVPYQENIGFVTIEYSLLYGFLAYELLIYNKTKPVSILSQ